MREAVQGRQNLIRQQHNDELQKYITGIISGQGQKLIAINNMPDHFHILIDQRPNVALSDVVRHIKAGSSGFINDRQWIAGRFSWQEGFGAFSYSHSQLTNSFPVAPRAPRLLREFDRLVEAAWLE
ncbi:MAG TPA: transposase, partial [Chthoniobacterales bacterium]|nr:transposase [Chthoniobacterales bacterium]